MATQQVFPLHYAKPPERILLLAPLPIGDTLFVAPTIEAIRYRYPTAYVMALVHSSTASLMRCIPGVDDVMVLPVGADWKGPQQLAETLVDLREREFDVAVDFSTPALKWISFLCGVPQRTYMKFDPLWWMVPGEHAQWRATHATRHYYDCARELALPPWPEVNHTPCILLPDSAREQARAFLHDHDVDSRHTTLVGIHPGGAMLDGVKRWPVERFATLADRLCDRWDARILLFGGSDEAELAADLATRMRHRAVNAVGVVPLLTSLALIEACALYVGNDSGLLHAAAALGTPYVGIYGPTSPANFHPIPARPRQGRLVLPFPPCREPQHFVGGDLVTHRPCCQGLCQALSTIPVSRVAGMADALLSERLAPAGAH